MGLGNELWLVRHGETEWSLNGRHTGRTDLPLTDHGREQAARAGGALAGRPFALVLTSPLQRARETCAIAGYGDVAEVTDDLREWDYGDYEGLTTAQIREHAPEWTIFRGPTPGGETVEQVALRADHVVQRARAAGGDAVCFAHGHFLRVVAARWLGLGAADGRLFTLDTATVSVLGHERDQPAVIRWNAPH